MFLSTAMVFGLWVGLSTSNEASPVADAPGVVACFVFDADGLPLSGASVSVGDQQGTTDQVGAVELPHVSGTWPLQLVVDHQAYSLGDVLIAAGRVTEALIHLHTDQPASVDVESPLLAPPQPLEPGPALGNGEALEPGLIVGRIVSFEGGEGITGVRVLVRGQATQAITDEQGAFRLTLPPGDVALSFVHPDYSAEVKEGLTVVSTATLELDVQLTPAAVELESFRVEVPHIAGSLAASVDERRNAGSITEVLGAEQMSQGGDGDAAGALRRVTGVTVVGGRYVYVRGLGERYSSTLLNGAALPSPEPERRVVPLDLFPTGILDGMVIHKTYSPALPGEFGGGTVELRTRGISEERVVSVGMKLGGAVGSTFTEGLGYRGGPFDSFGFDGGTRALPATVQAASDGEPLLEGDRFSSRGYSAEELERFGEQMAPAGGLERSLFLPDGGFDLELGDRFSVGAWDLGYRLGGGWSRSQRRLLEERSYYLLGQGGAMELAHSYAFESGTREVNANALLILGARLGEMLELGAMTFVGRMSDDEARIYEGLNRDVGASIRVERLRWVERTLLAQQLMGRHRWSQLHDLSLDWTYTYALALRGEPDRREVRYDNEPGTDRWLLSDRPEGNQRLFSELLENSHDLSVSVGMPFLQWNGEGGEWHVGAKASWRDRTVDTRRYKFMHKGPLSGDTAVLSRRAGQVFTKETIGPSGFQFEEITRQTDNYSAGQTTAGAFAHLDMPLWTGLRFDGGLRVEYASQRVSTFELFNPNQTPVEAELETTDVLPAATLSLQLPWEMQLRLGGSVTVSRPDFRELSPATFNDVTGGRQVFGNPDLERSLITASDARWEWYPLNGTHLSTAVFYKHFDRPIEQVVVLSAQQSVTFANAVAADNTGIEFEGRTDLSLLHPAATSWFVGGNGALIYSQVQVPADGIQTSKERALQGQSPWIANLQAGFDDDDLGSRVVALYNVFGPRISEVGAQGAPDVYEQPVHSFDIVASQRLTRGFSLGAKVQNLLDAQVRYTQGEKEVASLRKGQAFSLSLSWDM